MSVIEVRYDNATWIDGSTPLDRTTWATQVADEAFADAGIKPKKRQLAVLVAQLRGMGGVLDAEEPFQSFIHLADVNRPPLAAAVLDIAPDADSTDIDNILTMGHEAAIEPPTVESVDTPIGPATRMVRCAARDQARRDVFAGVMYLWHLEGLGVLTLSCSTNDIADFSHLLPDVDRLAQAVAVVHDPS